MIAATRTSRRALLRALTYPSERAFQRHVRDLPRAYAQVWREIAARVRTQAPRLEDHPITGYDDYRSAFEAAFASGRSPLSGERVEFWCTSSGTTGRPKLFPITRAYRRQLWRANALNIQRLLRRFPHLFRSPLLALVASATGETSPTGVPVGYIGHYLYSTLPAWLRGGYAGPLALYRDADTFQRWAPLYAAAADLSGIIASVPATVSAVLEQLQTHRALYRQVLGGQREWPPGLPSPPLSAARRTHVRRVLESTDAALDLAALWPSLQGVCCWQGAICAAQLPALRALLSPKVAFVEQSYGATEGFVTVAGDSQPGGTLHPTAHLFEFIEVGQPLRAENLLKPWQLKPGRDYEIFFTTAMGLIRYWIKDIVRCGGYHEQTPRLAFQHKADHSLSLGWSAVSEAELVSACQQAAFELHADFRFGPAPDGLGLMLYYPAGMALALVRLPALDEALCALNTHYERQRRAGTQRALRAYALAPAHPLFAPGPVSLQSKPRCLVQHCPVQSD
jgi:hypothetical protein